MRTLETERLILRDWNVGDIGCEVFGETTIRYLIGAKNNYALVLKATGEVIGTMGLNEDADGDPDVRNVGIRVTERYRGLGLMSEALAAVIENIGDVTHTLSYFHQKDDVICRHIAEKLGFSYVKTFYNVTANGTSEPSDYLYYRLNIQ